MRRTSLSLALAVILHLAGLWVLSRLQPAARPAVAEAVSIEVSVVDHLDLPGTLPVPDPVRETAPRQAGKRDRRSSAPPGGAAAPGPAVAEGTPAGTASKSAGLPAGQGEGHSDFLVLEPDLLAVNQPHQGAVALRLKDPAAGLGSPQGFRPGQGDTGANGGGLVREPGREERLVEEQTRVEGRIQGWVADDAARKLAEGPHDPYWRVLRQGLEKQFTPDWDVLENGGRSGTSRGALAEAVRSWKEAAGQYGKTGSVGEARQPGTSLNDELLSLAPQDRGQRGTVLEVPGAVLSLQAAGKAAASGEGPFSTRLVVHLLLTQRPDGRVLDAQVVGTSGNLLFDRLALGQIRRLGVELGAPPEGHLRTLWAFQSDFVRVPPLPIAGCALDDFIPRHCFYPLQKNVSSRVTLEAIY